MHSHLLALYRAVIVSFTTLYSCARTIWEKKNEQLYDQRFG